MLRVTIDYIPLGEEADKATLDVIEIANVGAPEGEDKLATSLRRYRIHSQRMRGARYVTHDRAKNAHVLAMKAISMMIAGKASEDEEREETLSKGDAEDN